MRENFPSTEGFPGEEDCFIEEGRASVENGSQPPAVVEGMVAKTNTDDGNAIIYPYYIVAFAIQA